MEREKSLDLADSGTLASISKPLPNKEAQEAQEPVTFPEGGIQAWLTVIGAFLMQFSTFGYTISFGVYQGPFNRLGDYYVREYLSNYTPSQIGWIGGTQIFLVFSCGIITGRLFDRGYFRHIVIGGTLLHAFSFFMLSLTKANNYYQVFLSHGLGAGLGVGIVYVPCLGIASHYFRRNRPFAMGIISAGTALGGILHPIMLNHLFHSSIGFHNGVRISAGLNSCLFIISILLMKTRLPPKEVAAPIPFVRYLRDPPYLLMVIGGVLVTCGLFFPPFYIQIDAILHGIDRSSAFYYLSILNASSIFGRIVPAALAPQLGVTNLNIFFTLIMGILIFCMYAVKSTTGFILYSIAFGFFSGGAINLTPAMLASIAKNVDEVGSRMGVSFAFSGFIGLFATPILGALLTSDFHWLKAVLFAGITMICGVICLIGAAYYLMQQRGTRIV